MKTYAPIVLLVLSAGLAFGSVRRVPISKSTEAKAPIEFSVVLTPDMHQEGYVTVELILPPKQDSLADLWKIYLWVLKDKKTVLGVPLDLVYSKKGAISVRYHGHVDIIRRGLIALRCGKHAPLSETIYQIDVGSYLEKK